MGREAEWPSARLPRPCIALRCAAPHREMLIRAPAHVHLAHASLCCWGKHAAHSQPALRTGLMAPAWNPALCIWGAIIDLTWPKQLSHFCSRFVGDIMNCHGKQPGPDPGGSAERTGNLQGFRHPAEITRRPCTTQSYTHHKPSPPNARCPAGQ